MFRLAYLRLALAMNFPSKRMKAWAKHTPCEEHECDVCNPIIGSGMVLW